MKHIYLFIFFFSFIEIANSQAPTTQASNLQFKGLKAYGMSIAFDEASSGADKYLLLRSSSEVNDVPSNIEYTVGEWVGDSKVFGVGNYKTLYEIRNSVANTNYYFAVFAYNVAGSNYYYNTTNPLKGNKSTNGANFDGFYDNYRIDTEDAIDDMSELLLDHYHLDYGDYYSKLVRSIFQIDTTNNKKYVVCEYSNLKYLYDNGAWNSSSNPNGYNNSIYNREHVTPKSWMPTNSTANGTKEGSDYHNLFCVKAEVNNKRSANAMDIVVHPSTWAGSGDSQIGDDANFKKVFEPKNSIKGNVARAMFYQTIAYDGYASLSWAFNNLTYPSGVEKDQDVAILLQWHAQDPPDNFEIARNEYIYSQQGNRNPFVDHPEWVKCIDFKTLTLSEACPLDTAIVDVIVDVNANTELSIYPNPVKEKGYIKLNNTEKILNIELINLRGQKSYFNNDIHENIVDFNVKSLPNGIYFVKVFTENKIYIKKMSVK